MRKLEKSEEQVLDDGLKDSGFTIPLHQLMSLQLFNEYAVKHPPFAGGTGLLLQRSGAHDDDSHWSWLHQRVLNDRLPMEKLFREAVAEYVEMQMKSPHRWDPLWLGPPTEKPVRTRNTLRCMVENCQSFIAHATVTPAIVNNKPVNRFEYWCASHTPKQHLLPLVHAHADCRHTVRQLNSLELKTVRKVQRSKMLSRNTDRELVSLFLRGVIRNPVGGEGTVPLDENGNPIDDEPDEPESPILDRNGRPTPLP